MKVRAVVKKITVVEVEVDDVFSELKDHIYLDVERELANSIKCMDKSVDEIIAVFDETGNCLINNIELGGTHDDNS